VRAMHDECGGTRFGGGVQVLVAGSFGSTPFSSTPRRIAASVIDFAIGPGVS